MEKVRRILEKIFNVRNFLIVAFLIALVCVIYIKIKGSQLQKIGDDRLKDFSMDSYKDDGTVSVSKALKECDIDGENIGGVVIGVDNDGEGIVRYYITDKTIINKVYDKLSEMKLSGMSDSADEFVESEEDWDIQLYPTDMSFAFRIYGQVTKEDGCYRTAVMATDKSAYYVKSQYIHQDLWEVFGSEYQLYFNTDIISFIDSLIDENIDKISLDDVVKLYDGESVDYATLFGYEHGCTKIGEYAPYAEIPDFTVDSNIFEFPIEGTECYVQLELYYDSSEFEEKIKLLGFKVCNSSGETINLLETTEDEITEFCK